MNLDADIALALRLADAAGAAIRPHFRSGVESERKGDASPVTIADRAAEEAMRRILKAEVPRDSVIGDLADAIVAAWLGLEQSAADAGAARGKSETPGEFALRVITLRDGLSRDARTLLGLYQRVRFGEHDADEADRAAARRALQHLEEGWR